MVDKRKILEKMFLQDKPTKIIMSLKGSKLTYAATLAKETDCTYSHCVRILKEMKDNGLVEFEKKGRIKHVKLSRVGEDIAFAIESLSRTLTK